MSELSRDEALVAAAVWMATGRTWESCKEDARGAIHSNRPASAEIRTALAGGGGGGKAERAFWEEVRRRDNEVVKYLTELGAANTAFHAGWVSRADHRALESRLAAAEQREKTRLATEESERNATLCRKLAAAEKDNIAWKERAFSSEAAQCAAEKRAEEAERRAAASNEIAGKALGTDPIYYNDGCVAALADHAENLRRTNGEQRGEMQSLRKERDAALARVKELESRLAKIRDVISATAGAQP